MDMSQLFSFGYYFSHEGLQNFESAEKAIGAAMVMITLGVILSLFRKFVIKNPDTRKLMRSFPKTFIWFGVIALFLIWMRVENVPYLSLRLWWAVYVIILLIVFYFLIRNCFKKAKIYKQIKARPQKARDVFLPTRKKKFKGKKR